MTDDEKPPEPPFATTEDLEARWHPLTESETSKARTLLDDASDKIMSERPDWRRLRPATLRRVCCAMVRRAMTADATGIPDGATQFSQTTGSFTDSVTLANPNGDLYLTSGERRDLGIGRQHAFSIDMSSGEVHA